MGISFCRLSFGLERHWLFAIGRGEHEAENGAEDGKGRPKMENPRVGRYEAVWQRCK